MSLKAKDDRLQAWVNGRAMIGVVVEGEVLSGGGVGLSVCEEGCMSTREILVNPIISFNSENTIDFQIN